MKGVNQHLGADRHTNASQLLGNNIFLGLNSSPYFTTIATLRGTFTGQRLK